MTTKFHLKHHWGRGKAALGFGSDRIRTLVTMATDSSHRAIKGKIVSPRFSAVFDLIIFILAGNADIHMSLDEFGQIRPRTTKVAALECQKKSPNVYFEGDRVSAFLIGPYSYLQVTRTYISACMNSN